MRKAALAERILAIATGRHRAEALVGDLLEEEPSRGRAWFWWAVAGTAAAFAWLNVVGFLSGLHTAFSAADTGRHFMNVWRFVWSRKWLVVVPVALFTTAASVAAYSMPVRYRAESRIGVIPSRVPESFVRSTVNTQTADGLQTIKRRVLSRTRLASIVAEFDLYEEERKSEIIENVIERMRNRDVTVEIEPRRRDGDPMTFTVGFKAGEPQTAVRVSARLAGLFIQENTQERQMAADETTQFLEVEIEEAAERLDEFAARIAADRTAHRVSPPSVTVEYEELQNIYRALLVKREQAEMALNMERRMIGEQFRVLEFARLPTRPDGPDRVSVSLFGATAGLGLGLVLMLASARRRPTSPSGKSPA